MKKLKPIRYQVTMYEVVKHKQRRAFALGFALGLLAECIISIAIIHICLI